MMYEVSWPDLLGHNRAFMLDCGEFTKLDPT